jgi:hypothetical protein
MPQFSPNRYRRRKHLLAGAAVAEARALDDLLLGDGDDVDGNGVELSKCTLV